ncbi:hypothetical protein AB833_17110 [Chromatiales bacterium (ex Bugula neritina AB1)]|nr:hypothetical protein AB833_17110 [Chromatiales bacterium (ex Bugula neritina AB1)]
MEIPVNNAACNLDLHMHDYSETITPISVLILDDDAAYAHLVSRYITQKFKSAIIDTCCVSLDALEKCLSNNYSVLIIDYNLPDLSGSKFLHKLQSEIDTLPPPAIMLTADGGASAAGEALRANAYDFLPKHLVNKESLVRSMKNAMAKHELQKSIRQRTIELEQANQTLHERSREIRDFYQTVSHEVKTPLAANREFVSLVRDKVLGPITDQQAEALDYALASCDQITSHFNDLVEMTRLDAGKITLHKSPTDVNSILTRTIASCTRAVEDRGIKLEAPTEGENFELFVDGDRIIQVLSNLLSNAIKYTPQEGIIRISMNNSESAICFCVSDSGCGIDEQHLNSIFNRLYQIGDENHEYTGAGLGLGLSIAREIVVLHEGSIWAESEVGSGSQFYVKLPHLKPQ